MDIELVTDGLKFPEGPIAMNDGSVILTEIEGQTLTRVTPDGRKTVVAETGGGPNGAAIGPDGKIYVTNNGGSFHWLKQDGLTIPGPTPPSHTQVLPFMSTSCQIPDVHTLTYEGRIHAKV